MLGLGWEFPPHRDLAQVESWGTGEGVWPGCRLETHTVAGQRMGVRRLEKGAPVRRP